MYVVVNTTRGPTYSTGCYLMPGEEPITFNSLDDAAQILYQLMDEYGHTLETARVYELTEVPMEEIAPLVAHAKALAESDAESL